jgi:putative transposase
MPAQSGKCRRSNGRKRSPNPPSCSRVASYFLPGDLEYQITAVVEHYNHRRYHEGLDNVTPAGAYFGRAASIIKQRESIKRQSIENRRLQNPKLAA